MIRPALLVDAVGKCYSRYASEWRRFAGWFGLKSRPLSEKWVLRNISFRVDPGEAVAIIGQNGAGKSTLLKLVTGTLQPNEGRVVVNGRISALLELGLGFNPELTGRENVVHVASMAGIPKAQIHELLPEIEAFAEVGEYFDQPVRVYSSGMQMRVAFSVATALRPDILIVDEALAVGDTYFVHKSFQRIREFREAGTTLLFVSHDPGAVRMLCDRAVLLDAGGLVMEGDPADVLDYYNGMIASREKGDVVVGVASTGSGTVSGSGEVDFEQVHLLDELGAPVELVRVGQSVTLRVSVRAVEAVDSVVFGYMIRDRLGQPISGTNTHHLDLVQEHVGAGERIEFDVALDLNLGPGSYSVSLALHAGDSHVVRNFRWRDLALLFNVVNLDHPTFVGCAWMPPRVSVRRSPAAAGDAG